MKLVDRVNQDLKEAMKAKDETRLAAIRALRGEILKQQKSGSGSEVSDEQVIDMVKRQVKQRQDAIEMFKQGNREDLVAKEESQMTVLQEYLPQQLSDEELAALVDRAIADTGAESMKDMGGVMKTVQQLVKDSGKDADNRQVAGLVKTKLSS